jgi:hypothetical protein
VAHVTLVKIFISRMSGFRDQCCYGSDAIIQLHLNDRMYV